MTNTNPVTAAERLRAAFADAPPPDRRLQRKQAEQYAAYTPEVRERFEQMLTLQEADRELFAVLMKEPTARMALGQYISDKAAYEAEEARKDSDHADNR